MALSKNYQSIVYYANCIVADGIKKGKHINAIKRELMYVIEYSETLKLSDMQLMIDIGTGLKTA